jgi:methylated-DNA-[protein]-cysteine S-methyltransferase
MQTWFITFKTPLGEMLLLATPRGIAGAWFVVGHRYIPEVLVDCADGSRHKMLQRARKQILEYFAGKRTTFDVTLDLQGTPFQQQVWTALVGIPYGKTTTYGAICKFLKAPKAARAVGGAVGHNPVSIIVPCHRVVGSDGSLTGYGGGLDRKLALLELEGVSVR